MTLKRAKEPFLIEVSTCMNDMGMTCGHGSLADPQAVNCMFIPLCTIPAGVNRRRKGNQDPVILPGGYPNAGMPGSTSRP